MPELDFKVTNVEPAVLGFAPLLNFRLEISNQPVAESIHSVMLRAQIQIGAPQRDYNGQEKEKLAELFGAPPRWGQTLRNRFWTNANLSVGPFTGSTVAQLPVLCTYDLNVASAKYFYALEQGDVPLIFLFSGTVFYAAEDGQLQIQQIPWNKESVYAMPVQAWRELLDGHYPNSAWLYLNRQIFDQLYAYKRRHGLGSWEQAIERLLLGAEKEEVPA
jgi:hypothetical protein